MTACARLPGMYIVSPGPCTNSVTVDPYHFLGYNKLLSLHHARIVTFPLAVGEHGRTRRTHLCLFPLHLNMNCPNGMALEELLEASPPTWCRETNILVRMSWYHHLCPASNVFQADVYSGSLCSEVPVNKILFQIMIMAFNLLN